MEKSISETGVLTQSAVDGFGVAGRRFASQCVYDKGLPEQKSDVILQVMRINEWLISVFSNP